MAQQQCVYEAYKRAGLKPQDADYVELHATGSWLFFLVIQNAI
jgi:acyl transferase domain-containing protein